MENEKINNFVQVCIKLDEFRFSGVIDWHSLSPMIFPSQNRNPSNGLFLFWLCSSIDQFYPYPKIWGEGGEALFSLIRERPKTFLEIKDKFQNIRKDGKGDINADIIYDETKKFVLVRDDFRRIQNTFNYLDKYLDDNISMDIKFVKLLGYFIDTYQGENGILKFAYYLDNYLFSHNLNKNAPSERDFLNLPRKRLWMFIMFLRRDPIILDLFKNALIEVFSEVQGIEKYNIWTDITKFNPNHIELPGDMWNDRLFKTLLTEITELKSRRSKKFARTLGKAYDIPPCVFDITFEIGSYKCKSKINCTNCIYCPFGDNKKCHYGKSSYCSIPDWLVQFSNMNSRQIPCRFPNCSIGQNLGLNLCSREIDKKIVH